MANKLILIHIGLHKTSTTFFQKEIFIEKNGFSLIFSRYEVRKLILEPHFYQFWQEENLKNLKRIIEERLRKINNNLRPIISEEEISGNPHSGGVNTYENLRRINYLFPTAEILITIREYKSVILSTYNQYVKIGGNRNLDDYLNPSSLGMARSFLFNHNYFRYTELYKNYVKYYGAMNVKLIPMELIISEPKLFISILNYFFSSNISSLTLSRRNESHKPLTLLILRFFNKFFGCSRITTPLFYSVSSKYRKGISIVLDKLSPSILNKLIIRINKSIISNTVQEYYSTDFIEIREIVDKQFFDSNFNFSLSEIWGIAEKNYKKI